MFTVMFDDENARATTLDLGITLFEVASTHKITTVKVADKVFGSTRTYLDPHELDQLIAQLQDAKTYMTPDTPEVLVSDGGETH